MRRATAQVEGSLQSHARSGQPSRAKGTYTAEAMAQAQLTWAERSAAATRTCLVGDASRDLLQLPCLEPIHLCACQASSKVSEPRPAAAVA